MRTPIEPCPTCGGLRTARYQTEHEALWHCDTCGYSHETEGDR